MKSQRHLVEASLADTRQHDVSPRKAKQRQKVEIDESVLDALVEKLRPVIRAEVNAELKARDRRSGSGD